VTYLFFKTWIRKFEEADTARGDLARDIDCDPEFPRKNNKDIIRTHLEDMGACDNALRTFEDAWFSYKLEKQRHKILKDKSKAIL